VTPKSDIAASHGEAEFRYSDLLPTGSDHTPVRLVTTDSDSEVEGPKETAELRQVTNPKVKSSRSSE
jgi:hypothetical protein